MVGVDRRERLLFAATVAALLFSVGAVGGAPRWAQALVTIVAAFAITVTAWSRRGFLRWSPLQLLLALMALFTVVQLVPLPSEVVELVSPTASAFRTDGAELVGLTPVATLSVDPSSTWRALAFLITLNALAMVALRLSVGERGRYLLLAAVATTCGITAGIAGIHRLVGAEQLYGMYAPHQAASLVMGPLLNPNHLGCLMAIGAVVAAGLLLYPRQPVAIRTVWALVAVACIAILAATQSRGALLALAVGVLAVLSTLFVQRTTSRTGSEKRRARRRREKFFATTAPLTIIVICAITCALYVGADGVIAQLENTSLDEVNVPTSKFAAWRSAMTLVEESPWTGIGRGAFEPAFTRVHPASAFATFSHPENTIVQAVVEWGIPATLVLVGVGIWLALFALRRWKDGPLAAGAIGALAAVAFQSNFDFGIELLGIAVPVAIVASTLCYVPLKELRPSRLRATRAFRIGFTVVAVCAALGLLLPLTTTIDEDHRVIAKNPTPTRIRESIERHPLDYYGYAVLAEQLFRTNDANAVRLLNHALRLHPTHPGLHRLAARLLLRSRSTSQAQLEYALALSYSVNMAPLLAEMGRTMSIEQLAQAIPRDRAVDRVVRTLQEIGRSDIAISWLHIVLDERPRYETALTLYSLAMNHKDLVAAEYAARARCRIIPGSQCQLALAQVLVLEKKASDVVLALQDVASWRGRTDERRTAWYMLCDAHLALSALEDARNCLRQLDSSGLVGSKDAARRRRQEALEALAKKQLAELHDGLNAPATSEREQVGPATDWQGR